tara:strand:- start:788 stop:1066 length:279 start_codon:yes stop_codon:yes gene_type:complete
MNIESVENEIKLIEAYENYIKVLKEKVNTRDEDINFWKEAVSHRDYKIKQYREEVTKLNKILDDAILFGPKFYDANKVLENLKEILNKSIYK